MGMIEYTTIHRIGCVCDIWRPFATMNLFMNSLMHDKCYQVTNASVDLMAWVTKAVHWK